MSDEGFDPRAGAAARARDSLTRRTFLDLTAAGAAAAAGLGAWLDPLAARAEAARFTAWGWPQPYERVSAKSVAWLKSKGWWPLRWGYQPPWMVEATVPMVIHSAGLEKPRGLEIEFLPFLAGPPLNEAIVAGKLQIGEGGDFPVTSLIIRNAPVRSAGIIWTPLDEHEILVRPDSTMKKPEDLKGKVVGLVTGSSAEFAFVAYCKAHGIDSSKDLTVRPMSIPDQATFPKGVDAVVPWAPTPSLMVKYLKNAKIFDDTGPYQLYWGDLHIRHELAENVPDVVQAVVDMCLEALLWQRLDPRKATDIVKTNPALQVYPAQLLYDQNIVWANNLKPTAMYPFTELYALEGARVAKFLYDEGRAKRLLTEKDYMDYFDGAREWVDASFKKLGWTIPKEPPFFPPGVTLGTYKQWIAKGEPFRLIWPYKLDKPQPWPGPGDLQRPWSFDGKMHHP
ncbi:MAG: NrtA/SsuA/CpmA family ABC transporter substrate-binding protein [bacterium]|nr:NrtA/SsuA/CpmA family ABC transporter substrate-binding protein [bacterium]